MSQVPLAVDSSLARKEEESLLSFTVNVYHDFYVKNDITMLLASLANDVSWCGGGDDMIAQGRAEVARFFVTTRDEMIPFIISNEKTMVHRISNDLINVVIMSEIATPPDTRLFLKEHLKCDCIYRRNPHAANGIGWELIHINNSVSYNKLKEGETFAVAEGLKSFWDKVKHHTSHLFTEEKEAFFQVIRTKIFSSFSADEKLLLSIASILNHFTAEELLFIIPDMDVYSILKHQLEVSSFLYLDPETNQYYLYPLMREFLLSEFSLLPPKDKHSYLIRAAQWFYSHGNLPEAMKFASQARDYTLCLNILEKGTDTILLASTRIYPTSLLDHVPTALMKEHVRTSFLMIYDLYFSNLPAAYKRGLNRVKSTGLTETGKISLTFLEGYTAFNNLDTMIEKLSEVTQAIKGTENDGVFHAPHIGFCCPSFTMMYHSVPGRYEEETEKLSHLQNIVDEINHEDTEDGWKWYFKGEYYFYTGKFEKAVLAFSRASATRGYREHLSLRIRTLHFRGFIAYLNNDTETVKGIYDQIVELRSEAQPYENLIIDLSLTSLNFMFPLGQRQKQGLPEINASMYYFPTHTYIDIMDSYHLMKPGKGMSLIAMSIRHEEMSKKRHSIIGEIFALLNQAAGYEMIRDDDKADYCAERALALAAPDHIIIPFLSLGSRLASTWKRLGGNPKYDSLLHDIEEFYKKNSQNLVKTEMLIGQKMDNLTARELGLIRFVMDGKKNKEIAAELHVAEITVKKSLSAIYKKLGGKEQNTTRHPVQTAAG